MGLRTSRVGSQTKGKPPRDSMALYAYYDRADVESQDMGFGYARASEIDIKEHRINQTKDVQTILGLRLPDQARAARPPPKPGGRDPKLR